MTWQDSLQQRREIIFATTSKDGHPNAIVVLSCGFFDGKLLIANCQMKSSFENIQNNPNVCIIGTNEKEYYRIKGIASVFSNGKFFNAAVKKSSPTPPVRSAIVVDIKEVFDLENQKIIAQL